MIRKRKRLGPILGQVVNWRDGLTFEVSYKTVIYKLGDGSESRESIRVEPRFRIEFTANFTGADAEDFVAEMTQSYVEVWHLPLPFRAAAAGEVLDAGLVSEPDKVHFPGGLPFWVVPGATIVVQTPIVQEHAEVLSVDPGTNIATLTEGRFNLPASFQVLLSMPVQFENESTLELLTSDVYGQRIALLGMEGVGRFAFKPFVPGQVLDTAPVITQKPNWSTSPTLQIKPDLQKTDFGFGRRFQRLRQDFVDNTLKMGFSFKDLDELEWYLSFVHHVRGRNLPFWYPTWGNLLDPAPRNEQAFATTNLYRTTNAHLGRNYSGSKTHRNLYFEYGTGQKVGAKITIFNVIAQPFSLQFNPSVPFTFRSVLPKIATWLTLRRLATDEVSFQFETSRVGNVELSMALLPAREVQP